MSWKNPLHPCAVGAAILICLSMSLLSSSAWGAAQMVEFDTAEQRQLYLKLIQEFRCLKCQNQNLAGSAADLADDLKKEIHQMVIEGKNRDQISDFLVARYGDFVLYRPRFKLTTALLWIGPFALLALGLFVVWRFSRKPSDVVNSAAAPLSTASESDLARARSLLED